MTGTFISITDPSLIAIAECWALPQPTEGALYLQVLGVLG